ncbi:MAG: type III-B CRISPR module-associated Cmr3 family protein [Chitinophagales bacterium]
MDKTMKSNFQINLTPIGRYFFGSENTFSAEDRAAGAEVSNYLVRSRLYPQQTTILGMLRYTVLEQLGKLHDAPEVKSHLVGTRSFSEHTTTWGVIERLSPMFLQIDDCRFLPAGKHRWLDESGIPQTMKPVRYDNSIYPGGRPGYLLDHYDPKRHSSAYWEDDAGVLIDLNKLFSEQFQVGIEKPRQGEMKNDAFYKQFGYKVKSGGKAVSFGCYVHFKNDECPLTVGKTYVVSMGADQSLFSMVVTETKQPPKLHDVENPNGLVLVSDAICDMSEVQKLCYSSYTSSVPFRFLETSASTLYYYSKSKADAKAMKRSKKYNLLERGSVLFSETPDQVAALLSQSAAFRNAGFNHFKTIKI